MNALHINGNDLTLEEVRGKLVSATSNLPKGAIYTDKVGFTITANDQIIDPEPFNDVILAYRDRGTTPAQHPGGREADTRGSSYDESAELRHDRTPPAGGQPADYPCPSSSSLRTERVPDRDKAVSVTRMRAGRDSLAAYGYLSHRLNSSFL